MHFLYIFIPEYLFLVPGTNFVLLDKIFENEHEIELMKALFGKSLFATLVKCREFCTLHQLVQLINRKRTFTMKNVMLELRKI